ncbi:MAG: tRNA (adenosine(37)-N6)-threonylcarbamoyltransferase complex transferase subunit TsaD [Phycisphaerales bacterium]
MITLGIESSCDETAAAVVRDGVDVLSNVVSSQYDLHAEYAGVVPEIASRAHVERLLPVVREALAQAGVGLGMIDAIAVGHRPGLIGCLLVGVSSAKALAWSLGRPLIGVDHVHAHLYSGVLDAPSAGDIFPALGLVVSGGHTAIFRLESWDSVHRLGGTIDDAVGEAYDKVATVLGLPHPGGPNLDRLACSEGADERAFELPVSRLSSDSLDLSFSGLKTAVLYAVRGVPNARDPAKMAKPMTDARRADIAASFQRAACRAITVKLRRAAEAAGPGVRTLLVGGGVSANSRLRIELEALARELGMRLVIPPMQYCMDNAAMVAGLGAVLLRAGYSSDTTLQAEPTTSL